MAYMGPWILGILATITTDAEERALALVEAEALLAAGSVSHNVVLFYSIAIELSVELMAWDEAERYARQLEAALSIEPSPRSSHEIAVAHALAWAAREPKSAAVREELRRLAAEQDRLAQRYCRAAIDARLKSP